MTDKTIPKIGNILTGDAMRDAIHIAVIPVCASDWLKAGQPVQQDFSKPGLCHVKAATWRDGPVGVIDPYLNANVSPGQWCYLFLMPGSITSLHHVWDHAYFPLESAGAVTVPRTEGQRQAEQRLREFAARWNMDYDEMVRNATSGYGLTAEGVDIHSWNELDDGGVQFWQDLTLVTGRSFDADHRENTFFSCSC